MTPGAVGVVGAGVSTGAWALRTKLRLLGCVEFCWVESLAAPGDVVDDGGITVVFGGTTVVFGGPELVGGGWTVVFGGTTVVSGGPELVGGGVTAVEGGCAPGVTALDGEGFVRGCGAGVGAACEEVLGGRAPAFGAARGPLALGVPEALAPPAAPPPPDPPVCENAALVAASMLKAASSPAASNAARR